MNEMTKLVQNHDYLTPRIAGKSGISKFKFYKYVRENGLEPVSRGVYSTGSGWVDELYVLIRDARMLFFHMTKLFIIMV